MKTRTTFFVLTLVCLLVGGMTAKGQIAAINADFYIRSASGPFSIRVAIQDYNGNVYNITALSGTYAANQVNPLPTPLWFTSIPIPSPMPMNYCRVLLEATYGGTTKYAASDWTSPDANGYIYPNTIKMDF